MNSGGYIISNEGWEDGVIGFSGMEMDGDAKNALSEYHFRKQES